MKNKLLLALSTAVFFSVSVHAEQAKTYIDPADFIATEALSVDTSNKVNSTASMAAVAMAASAPPITYAEIRGVLSTNSGAWEYVTDAATSTGFDHGGALMYVLVVEVGYGSNQIARMNGSVLPASANLLNEPKCLSGGVLVDCTAGQTIAGWYRYYQVSGHQNGTFQYQVTSTNSPWNTETDSLYIQ